LERDVQHAGDVVRGEGVVGRVLSACRCGWRLGVAGVVRGVVLVALTGVPCVYATVAP
jgi:hypothetical protein